jgi:HK97 family phage major capsid protein
MNEKFRFHSEKQLQTLHAELASEGATIATRSDEFIDAADSTRADEILTDLAEINERLSQFAKIRRFAPTGTPANGSTVYRAPVGAYDESNTDPMMSRARQAVETNVRADDNAKASAIALLENSGGESDEIADHLFRSSHPDYVSAFEKAVRSPEYFRSQLTAEESTAFQAVNRWWSRQDRANVTFGNRAAMSLTGANGGFLVPQFLDPTIVNINASTESDVRSIAKVVQTTSDQWDGVTSAGVTAEWLAEGSEATDATPTFQGPSITVHKGAAWMFGSYEMLADSGFDAVSDLISEARNVLEASAFISGTGSGQPYGLITRLSGAGPVINGTSGAAGAASLVLADLYAMDDALSPRFRRNASWLASKPIYNKVRALSDDRQNVWADFGAGVPSTMIGYNTYRAEDMDSTIVSGSNDFALILGDFSNFTIVDRIGTTIQFVPAVMGANQRPTGQAGWFSFFRTGADVLTSNAFKLLKL